MIFFNACKMLLVSYLSDDVIDLQPGEIIPYSHDTSPQ